MKNNNLIALAIAASAAGHAHSSIELYSQDDATFSVDGYFNAFYVNRDDTIADVRQSRVKMGFLPNTIGFNFSKNIDALTLGGRSSFWTSINDSLDSPTDTSIDVRQFYATVEGDFGRVLIGKDFGLYSRNNIFLDEILLGFGSPGAPGGVSFGNIRTGYAYPTPSAQITYRSPDMGGLSIAVGVLDPANTTGADGYQEAPRFESEVAYVTAFNEVDLTAWLNGRYQTSDNDTTNEEVTTTAVGYGVRASLAGFTLAASGFTADGDAPILIVNQAEALAKESADGFLLQGSYAFGASKLVLSYGETDDDVGDFETENTTVGLFHDINDNFKLVAEYNMFEQTTKSTGAAAADADTIALGAVVVF